MPYPARKIGTRTIVVDVPDAAGEGTVVLYARVSSHDQRPDLDRQVARLAGWAAAEQVTVGAVVTEVGSAMNGRRSKLRRLLADPSVATIVVEHRDRFARMNVELVEAALAAHGRRLVVVDDGELDDDLVRDMVEVMTAFCARLYGRRSARNRALKALGCARRDIGPADVDAGVAGTSAGGVV